MRVGPKLERSRGLCLGQPVSTDAAWYALATIARHEKQVARFLQFLAIDFYLPLYRVSRRWRDGSRVTLDLPLFPCYLFVNIDLSRRLRVLQIPGVTGIVNGAGKEPAPISDHELRSLRDGLSVCRAEPHPPLAAGQRGRIMAGALSGLEGVLLRTSNSCKVVLTLDLIMRSIAVEIDANDIEVLPAAS